MQILDAYLLSNDLAATENFYKNILGLNLRSKTATTLTFSVGYSQITFLHSELQNPVYHFTFHIPCNQLEAALAWISQKVALIQPEDEEGYVVNFENWNAKSFYFYDENGNILECIARFDLPNASNAPFSVKSLLGLSEIGIGTPDVIALAQKLNLEYDIPFFFRQIQRENFHALGNDDGLFVISRTDRNWYPTQCPVGDFYVKVKLLLNGKIIEITENIANQ